MTDIAGLVATARSQADIARRDREKREARAQAAAEEEARRDQDLRSRGALLDMARRSCASPGSVEQWELDALPDPYDKDFVGAYPHDADDCTARVFINLRRGADAEEIRRKSAPMVAAEARVYVPPIQAARVVAKSNFNATLPLLEYYARAACRTTERVPLNTEMTNPRQPVEFNKDWDDRVADHLAVGLGKCEALLFRKLIELIRSGQGPLITAEWVQGAAAIYRTAPDPSPGYSPPAGGGRGPRCEDFGNINCP